MASNDSQSYSPDSESTADPISETAASPFAFRSFRARLMVFLLCLLLPVLGGIFYYVNQNNREYTEETINTYLELGANVFDFTREQQAYTLEAITASLTWDFGFRSAYAANDPATLFDAALNVLERSLGIADMLMIADLENQVIIDTELQGADVLSGTWLELVAEADSSEDGIAEKIVTIGEDPFQLIALPLYLPRQVAWIIGGFALDDGFVQQVSDTIVSDVSILRLQPDAASESSEANEIVASTLQQDRQPILLQQLQTTTGFFDNLQRIDFGDEEYTTLLRSLYRDPVSGVQIVAVIQRSYNENNENVLQFRNLLIQFYSVVIALSLIAVIYLARSITNPLSRLATAVKRIEEGDYGNRVAVRSRDELGDLAESVNSMASGLAEKEKVRDLLGKVVSHQIAEELLSNPVELGGEERTATILFSDIRGFTSFCEDLPPQKVLEELNKVLSCISDIVEAHNGVVDKYQGDAVMALFGAPVSSEQDAANAMAAALEIIAEVGSAENALSACVGINTGVVVAGNLGSANRLNYSVIGDTVNLAARLESLTRLYNVPSIVSAASVAAAPQFVYRELDEVQVVGKNRAVQIYELVGSREAISAAQQAELSLHASALAAYRQQKWTEAREQFTELQHSCDNDALYQVYLQRIKHYEDNPPGPDWQGVFTFDKK